MRYVSLLAVSAIVLSAGCREAWCDDLKPVPDPISDKLVEIRLPTVPVTQQPDDPVPAPSPVNPDTSPVRVDDINAGELYVIESDSEIKVTGSPDGIISVTPKKGPRSFFARFVDGVDREKYEDRTYSKPFVYVVQAAKTGQCELLVFSSVQDDLVRQMLTVTVGPRPPPVPPDPPKPDPVIPTPPNPVDPVAPQKLQIVILEDPELRGTLPAEQIAAMDGAVVRQYVKTHCVMTGTTPDFRKLSIRQDVSNQPQWIKTAFAEERTALPLIVIMTPTQTISGPLPKTIAETMTLLKKYGGE